MIHYIKRLDDRSLPLFEQYNIIDKESLETWVDYIIDLLGNKKDEDEADIQNALDFIIMATDDNNLEYLRRKFDKFGMTELEVRKFMSTMHLEIGAYYYSGLYFGQDYFKAEKHYLTAFDYSGTRASIIAASNLGYVYSYGRTGDKDYKKAYYYFSYAAALGDTNALYKLGDMFAYGNACKKDSYKAFDIYKMAEEKIKSKYEYSYADVHKRLGDCYFYGYGTEVNYLEALKHYQKAQYGGIIKLKNNDIFVSKLLDKVEEQISACLLKLKY
ncbi:MAG: sel1 repeat family protein [Christensenellaceae bacterium]|nr:sel1 repeat family protein [Christensenellaceae bacterium]